MRYIDIVFLQGDDDITDALYNVEGVVAHGQTEESIDAAIQYMLQWDYGEGEEQEYVPSENFYATDPGGPWGAGSDVHHQRDGETCLVLSSHLGLGHAGLIRIIEDCPFCGQGEE